MGGCIENQVNIDEIFSLLMVITAIHTNGPSVKIQEHTIKISITNSDVCRTLI
jgi:hypothetical protein